MQGNLKLRSIGNQTTKTRKTITYILQKFEKKVVKFVDRERVTRGVKEYLFGDRIVHLALSRGDCFFFRKAIPRQQQQQTTARRLNDMMQ